MPSFIVKNGPKRQPQNRGCFLVFSVSSFSMSLFLSPCFSWFPVVPSHLGTPKQPTKWGFRQFGCRFIFGALAGISGKSPGNRIAVIISPSRGNRQRGHGPQSSQRFPGDLQRFSETFRIRFLMRTSKGMLRSAEKFSDSFPLRHPSSPKHTSKHWKRGIWANSFISRFWSFSWFPWNTRSCRILSMQGDGVGLNKKSYLNLVVFAVLVVSSVKMNSPLFSNFISALGHRLDCVNRLSCFLNRLDATLSLWSSRPQYNAFCSRQCTCKALSYPISHPCARKITQPPHPKPLRSLKIVGLKTKFQRGSESPPPPQPRLNSPAGGH